MATTTNMSISLPTVGVTVGPTYAENINDAFDTVDAHDHTSGKGVQVPTAGLNINADLAYGDNAATGVKFVALNSQGSNPGTNKSVFVDASNDLYYLNNSGTAVQITSGSSIAAVGSGVITYNEPSSFPYSVVTGDAQKVLGIETTTANTLNLPAATNVMAFWIKDITGTAAANNITVSPNGADTIDGAASLTLNENSSARMLMSDGVSKWYVL
jgi:hypothetical protein